MIPVRAAEEKEFLAFAHNVIGLANELSERGIGFSVAYGTFTFDMDTTRSTKSPQMRKKRPSAIKRDN